MFGNPRIFREILFNLGVFFFVEKTIVKEKKAKVWETPRPIFRKQMKRPVIS